MAKQTKKKLMIIGCSDMGASIASYMCSSGAVVAVVDRKKDSFKKLSHRFSGFLIEGDATHVSVLKEAEINNYDVVVVATDNDNASAFIAQICKTILGVKRVIVRLDNNDQDDILNEQEISIIHPADLYLSAFLSLEEVKE